MECISSTITIIYGPMFSGKTTKLIEIHENIATKFGNDKCIAFNYALDKRYGENQIISHDGLKIDCYSIINICDLMENNEIQSKMLKAEYIFINEAQFFDNIDKHVLFLNKALKKNVILCGLDLDYKREKFGTLMKLIPYATTILKMTGKCHYFKDGCIHDSLYSHRIVNNESQILIGSSEYIPLCEICYNKENIENITNQEIEQ